MIDNVKVGGKDIHAIIIECEKESVPMYRNALIETLKVASLNPDNDLEGTDVYTVLNLIQATLPEEKGGEV